MAASDASRLAAALTASLILHGTAFYGLSVLEAGGGGAGDDRAAGGRVASQPLQVRVVPKLLIPLAPVAVETGVSATPAPAPVPALPPQQQLEPASVADLASSSAHDDSPLLPGLRYFRLSEVDNPPAPLGDIVPDTAVRAQLGQREGYLVLRLFISETGAVDRVEVVQAQPPGVFDQVEVPVFSAARFSPAVKDGKPVRSQIVAEIRYFDETEMAQSSRAGPSMVTPVTPLQ